MDKTGHEEIPGGARGKYAKVDVTYLIHEDGSTTMESDSNEDRRLLLG